MKSKVQFTLKDFNQINILHLMKLFKLLRPYGREYTWIALTKCCAPPEIKPFRASKKQLNLVTVLSAMIIEVYITEVDPINFNSILQFHFPNMRCFIFELVSSIFEYSARYNHYPLETILIRPAPAFVKAAE